MSTKKLQIVTPIVTSVNGETGDVTLNSVQYTAQTLTDVQKGQARENIEAQEKICWKEVNEEGLGNDYQSWSTATNGGAKPIPVVKVAGTLYENVSGSTSNWYIYYTVGDYTITVNNMQISVSISPSAEFAFYKKDSVYHQIQKEFVPSEFFTINITNRSATLGFDRTYEEIQEAIRNKKIPVILDANIRCHLVYNDTNFMLFTDLEGRAIFIKPDSTGYEKYPYLIHQNFNISTGELMGATQFEMDAGPTTDMQIATKKYVDNGLARKASKDVATTSANGLMSSTDKTKLDGIAEGANKTTVDTTLSTTSTNPVQNKVVKTALDGKAPSSHTHDEYLSHPIQLQENTDYGTTLPSSPTNGRLFFQETSVTSLIDVVYPVGAVYISMNQTSPQTLFGGTWAQIQGRFLIGAGTAYPAGSTGGEATHTLTASEIPDHTHSFKYTGQSATTGVNAIRLYQAASNQYNAYSGGQSSSCGGQAHNNLPPYMAVYMWVRES